MDFWGRFLELLDTSMNTPSPYGWFHLLSFALSIIIAIILCISHKNDNPLRVRMVVFGVAVLVSILEIYKQINYSFSYGSDGISFDYQWYIFPWQFCSMPMYVGLLAGLTKKGKLHDSLHAFLGTYAVFAGLCVMFYPVTVFTETIGVNIQTMVCHGSMITVGIYLLYTGYVNCTVTTCIFIGTKLSTISLVRDYLFYRILDCSIFNTTDIHGNQKTRPLNTLAKHYSKCAMA